MGRHVGIATYWMGSACATLGLFARCLDFFGKNFIDFETKGGGFGYHSLMDGTLFFYAISVATMVYEGFKAQQSEPVAAQQPRAVREASSTT